MKVKQLIRLLKEMPQDLEVAYSAFDNANWEAGGDIISVDHLVKSDFKDEAQNDDMWKSLPDEWVGIHG